jgi:hypothetical protein
MAEVKTRINFRGRRSFVNFDAKAGSVKQQRKYGCNPAFQPDRAGYCQIMEPPHAVPASEWCRRATVS